MYRKLITAGLYRMADTGGAGGGGEQDHEAEGSKPGQAPGEGAGTGEGKVSEPGADGWTLEKALAEIKNLRGENAKHRKAKTEAERAAQAADEARLAEEKRFAELADKRAKERDEALTKLQEMEHALWRQKAAQAVGIPAELAARLQGDDEAALLADAQALAKLVATETPAGAPPGPKQRPAGKSTEELQAEALRAKRRRYGTL